MTRLTEAFQDGYGSLIFKDLPDSIKFSSYLPKEIAKFDGRALWVHTSVGISSGLWVKFCRGRR